MKTPRQQMTGLAIPIALLYLLPAALLFGYFTFQMARGGDQAVLILFGILTVMILLCAAFICTCRFRIDEAGVTFLTLTRRRQLPWQAVRCVEVQRLVNGLRVISISTMNRIPPYPRTRDLAKQVQEHTITISYTRARLTCLRQHWAGQVHGAPPA